MQMWLFSYGFAVQTPGLVLLLVFVFVFVLASPEKYVSKYGCVSTWCPFGFPYIEPSHIDFETYPYVGQSTSTNDQS